MPKTAGISLRGLLIDKFGPDNVWGTDVRTGRLASMERQGFKADNSQRGRRANLGLLTPSFVAQAVMSVREKIIYEDATEALPKARVVSGHFAVNSFDDIATATEADYFTILREPLSRMQSHYRYLQQLRQLIPKMRHWGEKHNPDLPFEKFAFEPELQNYQTSFTGNYLGRYTLVGIYEQLPKFFIENDLLEPNRVAPYLNKTEWQDPLSVCADPGFKTDFEEFHAQDYALYSQAAEM